MSTSHTETREDVSARARATLDTLRAERDTTPSPSETRTLEPAAGVQADAGTSDKKRESQATTIVRLVTQGGADLFHTPAGDPYIFVPIAGHRETHALSSRGSRDYLTRIFYVETGKAPNASALQDVIGTLSSIARFDGAEHEVYVRVAPGADSIYLDLGRPDWSAVEITRDGWRVVTDPLVRFRRPRGLLPLPVPARGGSIEALRPFLNLGDDENFALVVCWMVAALCPKGPYPIVVLCGEQGAAKSTVARVMRRCLDPSVSDLRAEPREPRDLMIAATNGHVINLDNLSRLPDWLSDALSRLATGGGFSTRTLYSDAEEQIFDAQRPTILNGIPQVATRPDLIERAMILTLPPIRDDKRRTEADLYRAFELALPRILGALLDAVSTALRGVSQVNLPCKPRMADFAVWAVAAEPACPWLAGTFLTAYVGNRQNAIEAALEGDPVVEVIRAIAPWTGTAAELLGVLNRKVPEETRRQKGWFAKPRQLSDALRRLAPALRRTGIEVAFIRHGHTRTRLIEISRLDSSASSAASAGPDLQGDPADAGADAAGGLSAGSSAQESNVYGVADAADDADAEIPLFSGHSEGEDSALDLAGQGDADDIV